MTKLLYRLRTMQALLSEADFLETKTCNVEIKCKYAEKYRDELRKQEIFLAHTDSLNDPMDGSQNMFWLGDKVLWKNLFRHYLLCLERNCQKFFYFTEEQYRGSDKDYLFVYTKDSLKTNEHRALYEEICTKFFSNVNIQNLINHFANIEQKLYQPELLGYLTYAHFYALECIEESHLSKGLLKQKIFTTLDSFNSTAIFSEKTFDLMKQANEKIPGFSAKLFEDLAHRYLGMCFKLESNNKWSLSKLLDYPNMYLNQLKQLTNFDGHVACFAESYSNLSMWSHYADKHRGACLIFKTGTKKEHSITLQNKQPLSFHKVNYEQSLIDLDFFNSLGKLPHPTILSEWFQDEDGKMSAITFTVSENYEHWHKDYWDLFCKRHSVKLKDWAYESEYRLIKACYSDDTTKGTSLVYDFNCLKGIIFGMNTPMLHKKKVIDIIKEKLKQCPVEDFHFYQAYYDRESCSIKSYILKNFRFNNRIF